MAYFKVTKVDGTIIDFDKKCDRVEMSPGEKFVYMGESKTLDNGEPAQIIHAIINSEDISEIIRYNDDETTEKDAEEDKPKKAVKKK